MRTIQFLEDSDTLKPDDWCRPLELSTMSGGRSDDMSFRNQYSGTPENHAKWVQVKHVIGKIWHGRTVADFNAPSHATRHEFVRGDIPETHRLDMRGYASLAQHPNPQGADDAQKGKA